VTDGREIVGIGNDRREIESRLKFASEVIARHLEYDRSIVFFHQIIVPSTAGVDNNCLVIAVAQACGVVAVNDGDGHYTYPVRRETGVQRVSREELVKPKFDIKSDNYDFLRELNQFILEN
jgi:hypothetical protein